MTVPAPAPYWMADHQGPPMTEDCREWWRWHFAGQALAGLDLYVYDGNKHRSAEQAVAIADCLLEELERPKL